MVDTSAFDQPEVRGLRYIVAALRVVTAMQCFGAATLCFLRPGESQIAVLLVTAGRVGLDQLPMIDRVTGGLLFACGMFSLTRPCWPVLGPACIYFVCESLAVFGQGDDWLFYLGTIGQASRFVAPLGLMLVDWYPPQSKFSLWRFMKAGAALRLAAAVTFVGHATMSIHAAFFGGADAQLIQDVAWILSERSLPDGLVSGVLASIGAIDLAAAANLLLTRSRLVAGWMAFWGCLTAFAQVFHFPAFEGVGEMLIRAANGGVPLVVFLYWSLAVKEREHIILPKRRAKQRGHDRQHSAASPHAH